MAVAAVIYDQAPPPPELVRAWDYKAWGVNVLDLPAGEAPKISRAFNTYSHLSAYRRAAGSIRSVKWTQENPDAWAFVSWVLAERFRLAQETE